MCSSLTGVSALQLLFTTELYVCWTFYDEKSPHELLRDFKDGDVRGSSIAELSTLVSSIAGLFCLPF